MTRFHICRMYALVWTSYLNEEEEEIILCAITTKMSSCKGIEISLMFAHHTVYNPFSRIVLCFNWYSVEGKEESFHKTLFHTVHNPQTHLTLRLNSGSIEMSTKVKKKKLPELIFQSVTHFNVFTSRKV